MCVCLVILFFFFCYNAAPMYESAPFSFFYHTHLTEGDADAVAIKIV